MFDCVNSGEGRVVYVVEDAGELVGRELRMGLSDAVDDVCEEVGDQDEPVVIVVVSRRESVGEEFFDAAVGVELGKSRITFGEVVCGDFRGDDGVRGDDGFLEGGVYQPRGDGH